MEALGLEIQLDLIVLNVIPGAKADDQAPSRLLGPGGIEVDKPFPDGVVKSDLFFGERRKEVGQLPRLSPPELDDGLISLGKERKKIFAEGTLDHEIARPALGIYRLGLFPGFLIDFRTRNLDSARDLDHLLEKSIGETEEGMIDPVFQHLILIEQGELVLFASIGRGKDQAAFANHQESRLQVGDVVIENEGVAEGQVEVDVFDLDACRPLDPFSRQLDLVKLAEGPPRFFFFDLPAAPDFLQHQLPGLDQGSIWVLIDDLEENNRPGRVEVHFVGPLQGQGIHLQLVKVPGELFSLLLPQLRSVGLEIGFQLTGGEVLLKLEDELRNALVRERGRAG